MMRSLKSMLMSVLIGLSSLQLEGNEQSLKVSMEEAKPEYLFKVISIENWEASKGRDRVALSSEDHAFIHFSREDQLERIVEKYWAKVRSFVILKIDVMKLPGDLVLELNPGGTNKYYHLYRGSIPLPSIVESRLINREPVEIKCGYEQLKVVEIGEEVLRMPARPLTKEEILSEEMQEFIQKLIYTMRAVPGVGLAAPQVGRAVQVVVVEDRAEYHDYLTPQQLVERGRKEVPLEVIINPTLHIEEAEEAEFFEGCLSVPTLMGIVPRAKAVRVECLNEHAEPVVIKATGWHARILQHEIDHLKGILYTDRVKSRTLMTQDNFFRLWKAKPIAEVQEFFCP